MSDLRCEFSDGGWPCEAPAVGGGGNGLAYCLNHRPCACGYILLKNGETVEQHDAMPGEPSLHTRERCR